MDVEQLRIVRVATSELVLDPANVRTHDGVNLAAITASLQRFGQAEPLVVQRGTRRVIGGNGRLAAMRELGWTECDVVELDVDEVGAAALGIALNRTAELASWDEGALAAVLKALQAEDALDGVGFTEDDVAGLLRACEPEAGELDEVAPCEPPANPVSRTGDLWILGEHRLLCGDSTTAGDVARVLHTDHPMLMVTDPPYGVAYDPAWRNEAGVSSTARTGKVTNDDRVDWTDAWRLFPGDVAYVWHAGKFCGTVAANLDAANFEIRAQVIWAKSRFALSRGHYHWQHEPAWYAVRRGQKSNWVGDRSQSTLWEIAATSDGDATVHGTQKPIECMARPMRNHECAAVYDPFLGSGTTLIAAERLGKRCIALEIDARYCDVIIDRWQRATGSEATLESGESFSDVKAARE